MILDRSEGFKEALMRLAGPNGLFNMDAVEQEDEAIVLRTAIPMSKWTDQDKKDVRLVNGREVLIWLDNRVFSE